MNIQRKKRLERKQFRDFIKIHLKINRIRHKDIASSIGLSSQEFHNMLNGFQSSVPKRGISSYEDFKNKLLHELNLMEI